MNAQSRAHTAYRKTSDTAMSASIIQAVFSLPGGWMHLAVDGAAVAFYIDLWNEIRVIYGRGRISRQAALAYLKPNLTFILGDLLLDKLLGMLPFAGSFFCFLFARAITWRLGAFFALTTALGEQAPSSVMLEKIACLVQALFPRGDFLFTLNDPDKAIFISLIAGLENLDAAQAEARITTALNVLRGEYAVEDIEITEDDTDGDDWEDDGAALGEGVEPLKPWDGGQALADEDDESEWMLTPGEEDGRMPWDGVTGEAAAEDAELVAAWEDVWRQWKAFQRQELTEEAEAAALAACMPRLRLLAETRRLSPVRPLLLTRNMQGEIDVADSAGQEGDAPITQGRFLMPIRNDGSAVATEKPAVPPVAASPKRPAATPAKKKATAKKKVVVKANEKKAGGK